MKMKKAAKAMKILFLVSIPLIVISYVFLVIGVVLTVIPPLGAAVIFISMIALVISWYCFVHALPAWIVFSNIAKKAEMKAQGVYNSKADKKHIKKEGKAIKAKEKELKEDLKALKAEVKEDKKKLAKQENEQKATQAQAKNAAEAAQAQAKSNIAPSI